MQGQNNGWRAEEDDKKYGDAESEINNGDTAA
jgi:hypothetical protein